MKPIPLLKDPAIIIVCALGSLERACREHWLAVTDSVEQAMAGQTGLQPEPEVEALLEKIRRSKGRIRPGQHDDLVCIEKRFSWIARIHTPWIRMETAAASDVYH